MPGQETKRSNEVLSKKGLLRESDQAAECFNADPSAKRPFKDIFVLQAC